MALAGPHIRAHLVSPYGSGSTPPTMLQVPPLPIRAEIAVIGGCGSGGPAIVGIPFRYLGFLGGIARSVVVYWPFVSSTPRLLDLLCCWGKISILAQCDVRRCCLLCFLISICVLPPFCNWSGVACSHWRPVRYPVFFLSGSRNPRSI